MSAYWIENLKILTAFMTLFFFVFLISNIILVEKATEHTETEAVTGGVL